MSHFWYEALTFPPPSPLTREREEQLSEMLGRIHRACREHPHEPVGAPYMTWLADLRQRGFTLRATPESTPSKLLEFAFTPHMDERHAVVGACFRFDTEACSETWFVRGEIKFTGLQLYLSGNEFERIFPPLGRPVPRQEWDSWGRGVTAAIEKRYVEVIYPKVIDAVRAIGDADPTHPQVVWDLGGGSGGLSEALCARLSSVARVVLVEQSDALLAGARERASRYSTRFLVERGDVTSDLGTTLTGTPDIIILCGVVAQQVLDREQGLAVMRMCHAKLRRGGIALIPSYSPALLTSQDYEAMGFRVHNKTLNVIADTGHGRALQTHDFYIVEKV